MKPYPNYKGNNLTDIIPRKIALVTEGANKKRFCLFKLKHEGESFMKKETALTLIKGGKLSEDEMKVVLGEVAEADKVEVQKAIDALKVPAEKAGVDVAKVAEEIVKAIELRLTAIANSLKQTTEALEKMVKPKVEEDPDITDEKEIQKLLDAEVNK